MVATAKVGVRELKNHAPKLVRRAAKGEHIVILRYGKPEAVLGPVEAAPSDDPTPPHVHAWLRQRAAFERLSPRLRQKHRGQWVAVHAGRVVGSDKDQQALFERMWRKLEGQPFFIGLVGAPPPIVDMPGFDVR